eukprot:986311-Rhodomonas_salina.1
MCIRDRRSPAHVTTAPAAAAPSPTPPAPPQTFQNTAKYFMGGEGGGHTVRVAWSRLAFFSASCHTSRRSLSTAYRSATAHPPRGHTRRQGVWRQQTQAAAERRRGEGARDLGLCEAPLRCLRPLTPKSHAPLRVQPSRLLTPNTSLRFQPSRPTLTPTSRTRPRTLLPPHPQQARRS